MKDILEGSIIVGGSLLGIFFFGFYMCYIGWVKYYIRIPDSEWKCSKAIIIDDDPSKTECIIYVRTKDIPK